jgi:hypothetical protein
MSGDGYGAHPAVQQHGMAEAERKPEGLFSKTVSRLKVCAGLPVHTCLSPRKRCAIPRR